MRRDMSLRHIRALYPPFEVFYACAETFHYLADAPYLVELNLELVDLLENFAEAGDFCVGHLDRVARAVVLDLCCGLCLCGQGLPSLLDGIH